MGLGRLVDDVGVVLGDGVGAALGDAVGKSLELRWGLPSERG